MPGSPELEFKIFSPVLPFDECHCLEDCIGQHNNLIAAEKVEGIDDLWSGFASYPDQHPCSSSASKNELVSQGRTHSFETPKKIDVNTDKSLNCHSVEQMASSISCSSVNLSESQLPTSNCMDREGMIGLIQQVRDPTKTSSRFSTEEIMRIAAGRFLEESAYTEGDPLMLKQPFCISISGLTAKETKNIDLVISLLAAADKVSSKQYHQARHLIRECYRLSSSIGNPVQRVVYYYADALQERIDRDSRKVSLKRSRKMITTAHGVIKSMLTADPIHLVVYEKLPIPQLMLYTSIHTIMDHVATAKKIHLIDLSIRHGFHWIILMQSLAARSSHQQTVCLKISAVVTSDKEVGTTNERLVNFAQTLSLTFHFHAVVVSDVKDLRLDMFEAEEDEAVGVYSSMYMNPLIAKPDSLEHLMSLIRKLKPCVMTVIDFEAKHNSPFFINRFTEALFYHGAIFDYLDTFMDSNDSNRLIMEGHFQETIKNIIALDDSGRVVRNVGINMWRSFFQRFGLVEAELNQLQECQASQLLKQFDCGSSCTVDENGKSLMVGWKGTPLVFISLFEINLTSNECLQQEEGSLVASEV